MCLHISEWHTEVYEYQLDFNNAPVKELAEKLRRFSCEATPKPNIHRENEKVLLRDGHNSFSRRATSNITNFRQTTPSYTENIFFYENDRYTY